MCVFDGDGEMMMMTVALPCKYNDVDVELRCMIPTCVWIIIIIVHTPTSTFGTSKDGDDDDGNYVKNLKIYTLPKIILSKFKEKILRGNILLFKKYLKLFHSIKWYFNANDTWMSSTSYCIYTLQISSPNAYLSH